MDQPKLSVFGYDEGCAACDELKALLSILRVPFTFTALERDGPARAALRDAGYATVPQVFTPCGTSLGGFSELARAGKAGIRLVQEMIGQEHLRRGC